MSLSRGCCGRRQTLRLERICLLWTPTKIRKSRREVGEVRRNGDTQSDGRQGRCHLMTMDPRDRGYPHRGSIARFCLVRSCININTQHHPCFSLFALLNFLHSVQESYLILHPVRILKTTQQSWRLLGQKRVSRTPNPTVTMQRDPNSRSEYNVNSIIILISPWPLDSTAPYRLGRQGDGGYE